MKSLVSVVANFKIFNWTHHTLWLVSKNSSVAAEALGAAAPARRGGRGAHLDPDPGAGVGRGLERAGGPRHAHPRHSHHPGNVQYRIVQYSTAPSECNPAGAGRGCVHHPAAAGHRAAGRPPHLHAPPPAPARWSITEGHW